MKLTLDGIKDRQAWEKAGIKLPGYDVEAVSKKAKEAPGWVHFGIGNIFRVFIGGIADGLLEEGVLDRGITCVETFDYDVIDKIYKPYDNLSLSVILHGDGTREYKVMGALAEAVIRSGTVEPSEGNLQSKILAAGFFHDHRKRLCPAESRRQLVPVCGSRYQQRSGQSHRSNGGSDSDVV